MWLIAVRDDIFYAVKELSRNLTAPTQFDLAKLKRLLRYLRGTLSLAHRFSLHLVLRLISMHSLTQTGQGVRKLVKALQEQSFKFLDVLSLHFHVLSKL